MEFNNRPCSFLWNRLHITYDGKVTACCVDFEGDLVYGDLTIQSLYEVWNNKAMMDLRKQHVSRFFKQIRCESCLASSNTQWQEFNPSPR